MKSFYVCFMSVRVCVCMCVHIDMALHVDRIIYSRRRFGNQMAEIAAEKQCASGGIQLFLVSFQSAIGFATYI